MNPKERENLEDGLLQEAKGGAGDHLLQGSFEESLTIPKPLQIHHMEAKMSLKTSVL